MNTVFNRANHLENCLSAKEGTLMAWTVRDIEIVMLTKCTPSRGLIKEPEIIFKWKFYSQLPPPFNEKVVYVNYEVLLFRELGLQIALDPLNPKEEW